jgi:hypothetical protein
MITPRSVTLMLLAPMITTGQGLELGHAATTAARHAGSAQHAQTPSK